MSKVAILDFGSQYTQVIARRVREIGVYSEILPYKTPSQKLADYAGIILSGGPASVYADKAPLPDKSIFSLGIPILGICYGLQLMTHLLGGMVARGTKREYGKGTLQILDHSDLFAGLPQKIDVWNSHGDKVTKLPKHFRVLARTENSPNASVAHRFLPLYGLQFHPEVAHTPRGKTILANFLIRICKCKKTWGMRSFITRSTAELQEQIGKDRVVLGLSGGVDSSVAAALLHRAVGGQLTCIFVDNGLLRANERETLRKVFEKNLKMRIKIVDASAEFLRALRGVSDPERKRKIIGRLFIKVFEKAAALIPRVKFLAQGTLYPDVIESVPIGDNPAAVIKSHHNVGGLPRRMKLRLVEPLRQLFKDEVRKLGAELGLPKEMLWRHPFPGPGLAVRCLGPVDPEKLAILRQADAIVIEEMKKTGWYYKTWQTFAVLLPVRSVGVMGDERSYEHTIAIRSVQSTDGMTADWTRLPHALLATLSNRIINEVRGVNRVVFDVTSKPPGTIEWE